MRPLPLLLLLLAFGIFLGGALHFSHLRETTGKSKGKRSRTTTSTKAKAGASNPDGLPSATGETALDLAGVGGGEASPESDVELLKGTVQYLEEQLDLTRQENARLRKLVEGLQKRKNVASGETTPGTYIAPELDELSARVADFRKLSYQSEPVEKLVSSERIQEEVATRLTAGLPADYFTRMGRAYATLGFVELEDDLLVPVSECVLEASGGLVPAKGNQIRFFAEDNPDLGSTTALRAGELADLLRRDQFGGPWPWKPIPGNDDAFLARLAVARGDASLVRFQIELAETAGTGDPLQGFITGREYFEAPAFLREQLIAFPRITGGKFAIDIHKERGWTGMDDVQRQPPLHTTLILHPDHFLSGTWKPNLPTWEAPSENGSEPIWETTLGELNLLLFLKRFLPEAMALQASDGWVGDKAAVYGENAKQGEYLWELRFATEEDTAEAFKGLRKSISLRRNWPLPTDDNPLLFEGSNDQRVGVVRVGSDGRSVLVAEALTADRLGALQQSIGW